MSLFKVCTWWTTQCPDYETNYDSNSLHCCRLLIKENEKDYIIVGAHSGYLSIFRPSVNKENDGNYNGFNPTDLLLEIKLSLPIIGILSGRFISSNSEKLQLAVLHPMKISIYSLILTEGVAEHGNQSKLELCFEYKSPRFAYSFCKGHFGGVKGKEFLCVIHMDRSLSFFEQDGIAYECKLPGDRNIPTTIAYVSRTDCFVCVTTGYELECYRYQDLCQSGESSMILEPLWSVCIGEYALDISVHQITNEESVVMILGENNLISVSDNGMLRFIKRLDYSPVCFHSFVIGWYWEPDARLITSVVSESGSLLIYEDTKLIWAAQFTEVPVAIQRSNLDGLPGAIVTVGPTGIVTVGFLGTDPNLFKVPPLNLSELNYEKAQKEIMELEKDIQTEVDFTDVSLSNSAAERELHLKLNTTKKLEKCLYQSNIRDPDIDQRMCLISLTLRCSSHLEQIQVCFIAQPPLKCSKPVYVFTEPKTESTERLDTWIYLNDALPLPSAEVTAIVSFINTQSICRIVEKSIRLPISMLYAQCQPNKDGAHKITLTVNQATGLTLAAIFSQEFSLDEGAQAIGLKYLYSASVVTIVEGKNSNRFRIHSDDFRALALALDILIDLIKFHKSSRSSAKTKTNDCSTIKIIVSPQIEIDSITSLFDEHYKSRENLIKSKKDLEILAAQMRLIQRRLLLKLEDKKSGALDHIMMLFKYTHNQIAEAMRAQDQAENELKISQINLSCAIHLIQTMIKHFDLPIKTTDGICSALCSPVQDFLDENWENITIPAIEMLNYIGPLKKNKNASLDDNPSTFNTIPLDMNKFKRYLASLLERVCRLVSKDDAGSSNKELKDTDSDDDEENQEINKSEWLNTENTIFEELPI